MATNDEQIRGLWDTMARSWGLGDAERFAAGFAEDCDFTTVRGEKPTGRHSIAAGHARMFQSVYRATTLDARIREIRYLRPDLATVDVESTIFGADGAPLVDTHALAIVERGADGGHWSITVFHNMVPARPAAQ